MSHEKWDDENIEQILSNMPNVEDKRSKDEVFQRLKDSGAFEQKQVKIVKKKIKWLPIVVTIAALFAVVLIIPPIFKNSNQPFEDAATNSLMDAIQEESSVEKKSEAEMFNMTMTSTNIKTAVYVEDLEQSIVLPVEMVSDDGNVIPIAILIEKEQVIEDFGEQLPTDEQLFNRYAHLLEIEGPGLIRDQQYNENPTTYYLSTQDNGMQYLVPFLDKSFSTVVEAIEQMKFEVSNQLHSAIIPGVDYDVSESEGVVYVEFSNLLDLTQYDSLKAMQMIEGILLTASSFGKEVQFQNIMQSEWEGFDFTKPLPIPVGANKLPLVLVR